jgi:hypothetical protein
MPLPLSLRCSASRTVRPVSWARTLHSWNIMSVLSLSLLFPIHIHVPRGYLLHIIESCAVSINGQDMIWNTHTRSIRYAWDNVHMRFSTWKRDECEVEQWMYKSPESFF